MGPDNTGTLSRLVDRFNRQNEGRLRADYREMPADTGQYFDQLRTEFQAGSGDITLIGGDVIWPAQLAASGYIEPLPGASAAWAGGTSTSTPTPTTPSRTPPTSS
jgi:multiple sugar transport system substrate-binding protein